MKYAVIKDGKVVNTVLAEPEIATERGWVECAEEVAKGWDYDGSTFTDNRPPRVAPTQPAQPTKEQLLQQIQELSAKIQAIT